ncbi:MAG: efflux RND transporter permease subunit [Acidobacteriota bacterium]
MEKKSSNKITREFKLTTFAINNRNTVFLLTLILIVFGLISYNTMPLETFPEVVIPNIFVKTIYPGNPPVDIENLISRQLEKEINTVNGIKKLTSTSTQDNSDIFIEFNSNVNLSDALQDVKDAVDRTKSELPSDLEIDPFVMDFDINEFPIININISGDYSIEELKGYAEFLEEEIETFTEISKVEIKGLNNREIQINIDRHKLDLMKLNFQNIEDALVYENISISGGELKINNTTRAVRTIGEFKDISEIENIIVKHEGGNIVYLKDVADVIDGFEDPLTYARLNKQTVVSLQVIKKSGENLINASEKIFNLLSDSKADNTLPPDLKITITNDQSDMVKSMVSNLENNIAMAIFFVILVLYFFLGTRNALFVGIAIPMSMTISFVILSLMGSTINMMVLFGLVLALGMLVDNAIVVVENTYRFADKGYPIFEAAKRGVGEIAIPIIASTATTLAAFFPLVFWGGIMGEFMKHLPITLIIVLTSSLFVALVIIPVFSIRYFRQDKGSTNPEKKKTIKTSLILLILGLLFYVIKVNTIGTIMLIIMILIIFNYLFLFKLSEWFRLKFLTSLEDFYLKALRYSLDGKRPGKIIAGTFLLLVLTMIFFTIRGPKVEFFPVNEPSFINITAELPIGSDINATNEVMQRIEDKVFKIIEPEKNIVKSVLTTIGKGVVGENEFPIGNTPNKGMITVSFVDYELRSGILTSEIMKELSKKIIGKIPGILISIEKNRMGPPTGKPVNIEIDGKDYEKLISITEDIQKYIENEKIEGIENLKMDLDVGNPELIISIDRERARRFGLSTAQIASTIRTSLFGKEVSELKVGEDEYPIILKFKEKYRKDIPSILDQRITFRSQSTGKIMQVPISAVTSFSFSTTYGAVKRKDLKRVITLHSNILEGFNANIINQRLKKLLANYDIPEGFSYKFTGEQEEQKETMEFLSRAMMIALSLIMIILVTQFNSFAKPFIIIASVFFSTIGVFGGLATFKMDFIIIMTGIGIISLGGVVVNNAIVLIDYIDYLKTRKKNDLNLTEEDDLPIGSIIESIIEGGKTRLRPVLLTAITTILGLVPMAIGLNINIRNFLSRLDPQIYFGGDNALFWGPMAWTVIFGLSFATFLTLILVPVLYLTGNRIKIFVKAKYKSTKNRSLDNNRA